MGSVISGILDGNAVPGMDPSGPNVTAFHSSERWKEHLESSKDSNKLMVVHFSATWSGPSKAMAPVINCLTAEYPEVAFVKINVDELPDVSGEFGVQAMPTFVLLKQGKEVERVVGAQKKELQQKILKHREVPKLAS